MSQQQYIPKPADLEKAFTGVAALPLAEIAKRAAAVSVPADVMARARAKLAANKLGS